MVHVEAAGSADIPDGSITRSHFAPGAVAEGLSPSSKTTFSVAAEASHAIVTTVQIKDIDGNNPTAPLFVRCLLSDAAGGAETATDPTSNTAVGGSGATAVLKRGSTHFSELLVKTGATGSFTLTTTQTAAQNYYWNILLPNGSGIVSSLVVAHAG